MLSRAGFFVLSSAVFVSTGMAQAPEFETTRVAEGVYQFRYQSHNGFFVETPKGLVAVDPISTAAAQRYAAEMKRVAPGQPLLAIVYSHDHQDHAAGAQVLRDAFGLQVPIIAHENALPKVVAAARSDLPTPDLTFSDKLTLHFGGRAVELHFLGKSHSDNMIVTYVPDVGVAFAVDFVANDRVGYRDLPDYHFPEFFGALERLQMIDFEKIVFGHGPPGDRASIRRQGRYYGELRRAVTEAFRNGWSEDEAAARIRLEDFQHWGQYENWFPLNVRAIYRWVASGEQ
jgi:cyclase